MSNAAVTTPVRHAKFEVTLLTPSQSTTLPALIDSGADANFIDRGLVAKLGIETTPLAQPRSIKGLSGRQVDRVDCTTLPLRLLISGNHSESICFHVLDSPLNSPVLGFP